MASLPFIVTYLVTFLGITYSILRLKYTEPASPLKYFSIAVLSAAVLCISRFILTKHIFEPLGRRIIGKEGDKHIVKVSKFGSCSFKTVFFASICYFEYEVLSRQNFTPSWLFGKGETANLWTEGYNMPVDLITVFMVSLGYHIHSTVYHCFVLERRCDFGEMLLHHMLTLWLMVLSYIDGYSRIGLLIVFLNDVPDIFVYATKSLGDTVFVKLSIVSYIGLVASYAYFRLVVFPVSLLPSLLYESNFSPFGKFLYISFLCSLTALHAHWFVLLVKIGMNLVRTGSRRDIVVDRKRM